MNDTVVAIVSAFFVIGIVMGIAAVLAMSVLRADRRRKPAEPPDPRRSDDHSRWPGDTDNDFSGR